MYPLSQYEYAYPPDHETIEHVARQVAGYVDAKKYQRTVMLMETGTWQEEVTQICDSICARKGTDFQAFILGD